MIGIIFIGNIEYCPYLKKYEQILQKDSIKYEVLFWNRNASSKKYPANYIFFNLNSGLSKSRFLKLFDFISFRNWLIDTIKNKRYTKLILLSTLSGIIIQQLINKKYQNKYIFDIRDYSYENIKLYKKIEDRLIKNSFFTCISSEGFKNFLPKNNSYLTVHNFNCEDLKYHKEFKKKSTGSKLNLVFIGAMRYFNHQSKIIDKLKNNDKFNLIYHGSGAELHKYKKYCEKSSIANIVFTGQYDNSGKYNLLKDADILNNSYDINKFMEVRYLISNKYYDGIIFGIPQLVEPKTYKCEKVEKNYLGIGIDINDSQFADELYEYYFSIDEEKLNQNCYTELKIVVQEDAHYTEMIKKFISN